MRMCEWCNKYITSEVEVSDCICNNVWLSLLNYLSHTATGSLNVLLCIYSNHLNVYVYVYQGMEGGMNSHVYVI